MPDSKLLASQKRLTIALQAGIVIILGTAIVCKAHLYQINGTAINFHGVHWALSFLITITLLLQIILFFYRPNTLKKHFQTLQAENKTLVETSAAIFQQSEKIRAMDEEMRQTVEEMQTTQDKLYESEKDLRGRIEAINRTLCMCEISAKGFIVGFNESMRQTLGYQISEFNRKHYTTFVHESFINSSLHEVAQISLENKIGYSGEFRIKGKTAEVWFNASLTPLFSEAGKLEKIIILANDITPQKLESIENNARTKAITQFNAIAEFNLAGKCLRANAIFLDLFGYTFEQVLKKTYLDFVQEEQHWAMQNIWTRLIEGGYIEGDFEHMDVNHRIVWLNGSYTPIKDLDDKPFKIVLLATDISKRKKAQKNMRETLHKLQEKEAELIEAQEIAGLGNWEISFLTYESKWSRQVYIQYGLDEMENPPRVDADYYKRIHPDDIPYISQVLYEGEATHLDFVQRIFRPNGEMRYLLIRAKPLLSIKNKKLIGYYGTSLDITESKKYQLEIEEKNMDIMASIEYAQRIQMAMLPSQETMSQWLADHFVLYMPKDVVSGDFYWFEVIGSKIFVIAADCTGHGVPGAFMSMLGNEILHEIVGFRGVHASHEIIQNLHINIRKVLKQAENKNHEGMDIGITIIDKTNNTLEFSGARNDLWYVQHGILNELKGGRKGVGGYKSLENPVYERTFVPLTPDTQFYMLSDGFIDQFGGSQGRKFMARRFRALIESCYALPFQSQEAIIRNTIETWRMEGGYEQIDDIMVLGVRI